MKRSYIPRGGYGLSNGHILTRSELRAARLRYARKHGYYVQTVRPMTTLFRDAIKEYVDAHPVVQAS